MTRHCRQCNKEFEASQATHRFCSTQCKWRSYYYREPEFHKARRLRSQQSNAEFVDKHKTSCADCGETDKRVLDFHHLRDKLKGVATLRVAGYSKIKILAEIAKCIVLCANCHRLRHWNEEHGLQQARTTTD